MLELAALALYLVITVLIHFACDLTSACSVMFSIGAHSWAFIIYSVFVRRLINSVEKTMEEVSHEAFKEHRNLRTSHQQALPGDIYTLEKSYSYLAVTRLFRHTTHTSTLHTGRSLGIYSLNSKCLIGIFAAILVLTVLAHFVFTTHDGIVVLFRLTSLLQLAVSANLLFFACMYGMSRYETTTDYQELTSRSLKLVEKKSYASRPHVPYVTTWTFVYVA